MKSNEFLIETDTNVDEIISLIKQDCQPYLQQNPHPVLNPLYRGIRSDKTFGSKRAKLADRTPSNMPEDIHYDLNKFMNNRFGHPFRNSVFCTGDKNQTRMYGKPYIIFPKGDFEFLWSPDIRDLFNEYHNATIDSDVGDDEFLRSMMKVRYSTKDLTSAITSKNEIMIWANEYYIIKYTALPHRSLKGEMENKLK